MTVPVGWAVRDVTPPPGIAMSGFAARTLTATGAHDPITVRALAVGETCLISVDVCGLHEDTCARIRAALPTADEHVVVTATHTHGGPSVMPGRLGATGAPPYLETITAAAIAAGTEALRDQCPLRMQYAETGSLPVAANRRHGGRPAQALVQALRFVDATDSVRAWLVSYPCHPVVLGADNTLWTADYPGAVRARLEAAAPGSRAFFLTGCAGDINTGHRAEASYSTTAASARTFEACARIGGLIADAVLTAGYRPMPPGGTPAAGCVPIELGLATLDEEPPDRLAARWARQRTTAEPGRAELLSSWLDWANGPARTAATSWRGTVSALRWGAVELLALPGEPFLATAVALRRSAPAGRRRIVLGYANGCPGYLPTAEEYAHGGYEVVDAHRYYGMPAPFAAGAAELAAARVAELAADLATEPAAGSA